jgi:predicted SnoaL-like aldol condensation-catalyzing enzyme
MKTITMTVLALALAAAAVSAQNATVRSTNPMNPSNLGFTPGTGPMNPCTLTPAQLQEVRRVALEFFRPGIAPADRVALADARYTQHNPGFLKPALEMKMSDFDYFKSRFGGPPAGAAPAAGGARQGGGGGGGGGRGGTPPPAGNGTEIVLQECDMLVAVHKNYVQDPTAAPGTYYARFTFDMFRVRDGKLVEHWDGARINAPAQPAAGGRGGN